MKTDRIKELLYIENTNYPFSSNELYLFFGFTRHNNFIRILKRKEFMNEIIIRPREKVNERKCNVYYITRDLFYKFCKKYLSDYAQITEIYLDYKRTILQSKILTFRNLSKPEYIFELNIYEKIKGHFYTHALNTLNIANVLNIDVYDLFKFCSLQFCCNTSYSSAKCTNDTNREQAAAKPYYSFDSIRHESRYIFIELLKTIKAKFKLDEFQKRLIDIYLDLIKQMLERQIEYDFKENRRQIIYKKDDRPTNQNLTKSQLTTLKIIFRSAAMLCHPDKNCNGEEIFRELYKAYTNKDLKKVTEIHCRLKG
ncbi:MAG: hypothetical protein U0W24_07230 [Bacteroidales bacterium]